MSVGSSHSDAAPSTGEAGGELGQAGSRRRTAIGFVLLLLIAAGIRLLAWSRTAVLFDDGPIFLYIAEAMADGDWSAVLRHPFHPLYSLLTWWSEPLFGDFEQAAAAVSIAAGVASVGVLFGFLRDAFGARTAWIGAGLLAIHPTAVEFSSDVQSDGLYEVFFLASAWLAWRAMRDVRVDLAGWAGVLAGFAYLVRPEGLGVVFAGAAGAGWLAATRAWGARRAALWCAVFALGAGVVAAPYVVALRAETGTWMLTQKKSLAAMASLDRQPSHGGPMRPEELRVIPTNGPLPRGPGLEPTAAASAGSGSAASERGSSFAHGVEELVVAVVPGLRIELLGFLAVGLWSLRGRPGHRGLFIGVLIGLYAFVLLALGASAGYVSQRHALPPLLLLFGYIARGVPAIGAWVLAGFARALPRIAVPSGTAAATVVSLVFLASFFVPLDLSERRGDRLAERRAAEWLRTAAADPRVVASRRIRAAYYAGADFVAIPSGGYPPEQLLRYLRGRGARHLIIDEGRVDRHAGLREAQALGMERLHRAQAGGRSASVYAILPPVVGAASGS